MKKEIFGREREKKVLTSIYQGKEPAFIALYGRRRVGKTYLVRHFFSDKGLFFHMTGIKDAKVTTQLDNFASAFSDTFQEGKRLPVPKNWHEAFTLLRHELEKAPPKQKKILFFDELPWLASRKSHFMEALDHFWNRYLSEMPNVILVVCGSAASWMMRKVINCRGGLHGRVTHEIPLFPFSLKETEEYLKGNRIDLDRHQILELYMAFGGVAKYLTYIKPGLSAAQIINALCFTRSGPLVTEFYRLYQSLFTNYESHISIVKTLAKKPSGLTYQELVKKLKITSGGTFSGHLKELQTSGFIDTLPSFGKGPRSEKYILTDEYSLFYLTWMATVSGVDLDDEAYNHWLMQRKTARFTSWKGLAFERICLKHLKQIKAALGISAISTKTSKWACYKPDGAEIDWVIDRGDHCINLFEAKYVGDEFVITADYAKQMRHKKECFHRATKSRKALFTTFITPYGLKKNSASLGVADQELTADALFV